MPADPAAVRRLLPKHGLATAMHAALASSTPSPLPVWPRQTCIARWRCFCACQLSSFQNETVLKVKHRNQAKKLAGIVDQPGTATEVGCTTVLVCVSTPASPVDFWTIGPSLRGDLHLICRPAWLPVGVVPDGTIPMAALRDQGVFANLPVTWLRPCRHGVWWPR
jgi:hypothetical protein